MIIRIFLFAIALIFVFPAIGQDSLLQQSLRKHVEVLASDSLEGRGEGSYGIIKARQYIVNEFKKAGVKPLGDKYEHDFSFLSMMVRANSQNIIAVVEGSDPVLKDEYIIIGAHYDHIGWKEKDGKKIIYNGADDNASGTAAIIELARLFNENKDLIKRSIVFIAFGAEESGLIGSKYFVNDSIIPLSKIKCMFSLDMVGMYKQNNGIELKGIELLKDSKTLVDEAKQNVSIKITQMSDEVSQRTDTKHFGENEVPSVHVNTGHKSPYHKPEDDSDLLDYEGMATTSRFIYELATIVANKSSVEPVPSLTSKTKEQSYFAFKPAIRLGSGLSSYKYTDEFYVGKSVFTFDAGLRAQISLSKHFAIQPEVMYATSGSKSGPGTMRTHQVEVPFHILFGVNNLSSGNAYIMLGGYYKYFLSGKNGNVNVDYSTDCNDYQYGLSYGIGFDISKFQVNILGKVALSELYSNQQLDNVYERGFSLNVGYRF